MAVQAALYGDDPRDNLNVIVHQRQKGLQVTSVDGVNGCVSQIDVLRRHRLLRQAERFESVAVAVGRDALRNGAVLAELLPRRSAAEPGPSQ